MRGKQDSQGKEKHQDEAMKGPRGLNSRRILAQLWRRVFLGQLVCATCRAYPLHCYRGLTAHKIPTERRLGSRFNEGFEKTFQVTFTEKWILTCAH